MSVAIDAAPEMIWALLTDAGGYSRWNSTVERIEGRIASGEQVRLYAKTSPGRPFKLQITEFVALERMTWVGGMPLGLFNGTRSFTLTPAASGMVGFAMRETYRGPLAPLVTRVMPDLQPAFDRFAADLKRCAEAG